MRNRIDAVVDLAPVKIASRPRSPEDVNFWQYPCVTELQAYNNHANRIGLSAFDAENLTFHTYVGLPWATYIDKQKLPPDVKQALGEKLHRLSRKIEKHGYNLRVHTVCQHICWKHMMKDWQEAGITDVHLSHNETGIENQLRDTGPTVHSWPLIAVNVETPDRDMGIVVGKHPTRKKFFTSFIGAHMEHYRSDVRLTLRDLVKERKSADTFFELNDEWHFQKIVYGEQVCNHTLTKEQKTCDLNRTRRYNEILSDSIFALCPEGSGPNTLRFWEALAVGSIPVIFGDDWILPNVPASNLQLEDCCVRIETEKIGSLFAILEQISPNQLVQMQQNCLNAYKHGRDMSCFGTTI